MENGKEWREISQKQRRINGGRKKIERVMEWSYAIMASPAVKLFANLINLCVDISRQVSVCKTSIR
jgi:hypothetical protein